MKTILLLASTISLTACSTIYSGPPDSGDKGLYYYMPKKDFIATITMAKGEVTKVALSESAAYPDLATRYVLTYGQNAVNKNTMSVGVNERGLLTSTTSEITPGISDVLKGVASVAGTFQALGGERAQEAGAPPPCPDGDQVFVVEAREGSYPGLCGVNLKVHLVADAPAQETLESAKTAGIYYRQYLPYRVTATRGSGKVEGLLFSPSQSPTHLLPIALSFFAHNKADFAFTDGVPTKFNQDADGELVGLLKLPADVIAAYFSAIGATFDAFSGADTKQASALAAETKLDLAKQKYAACLAAIKANDPNTISKLGC